MSEGRKDKCLLLPSGVFIHRHVLFRLLYSTAGEQGRKAVGPSLRASRLQLEHTRKERAGLCAVDCLPEAGRGKGDAGVSGWTLVQRRGRQRLKAYGKSESICRQQTRPLFFRQGWIRRGEGEHEAGSCMRHVFGLRRHVRSSPVCPVKYEIFPCVEENRSGPLGAGFSGALCLEERHAGYFFHCPADFFLILPSPYGRAEAPV